MPNAVAREFDDYLAAHPEAAGDVEAARTILEMSADIRASEPPPHLLAAARASILKAIRSEVEIPRRSGFWLALPRPAWMSALGIALAALFVGVLWRGTSTLAWAHVVEEVRKLSSVRTEGWFLGESGERVPVKHWFQAPHSFRAEVDTGPSRQVVLSDDESVYMNIAGALYRKNLPWPGAWSVDKVSKTLVLPEQQKLEALSYQIDQEDRGQTVLFSIWRRSSLGRKTPSDIRFEIEVDAQTRLPNYSRIYVDRGQQEWDLVNELNYRDYDVPLADGIFEVADDAVQPVPEKLLRADPFGRAVALFGPWHNRVHYMPLEGMEIVVHPPWVDPTKGNHGMSSSRTGGIVRYEFHRNPLTAIAQTLGDMPVETRDSALSEQRYSARIAHRITVDPVERVKRLGQRFSFDVELNKRQGTRTRWIFAQDGTGFPISAAQSESTGTNGKNLRGTGIPLFSAIQNMLSNAARNDLVKGYNELLDEVEMNWKGASADNPFHRRVDISVDFSDGWEVALEYLRENFGVTMERVSEPTTYEVLVLSPRNEAG
ncbi:MAG: hypothetical protein OXT71_07280 [Acidobacteriota bacterium]|nr:hypothetical protein [Acidobacteriota bacterium]